MGLLTITEANNELDDEVFPEWDALEDNFKERYLDRSGAYVRTNWTYDDTAFDWDDNTTWVSGAIAVIAQYADADRAGTIYGDSAAGEDSTSPVKRKTEKVGSLESTIEYAQPDIRKKVPGLNPLDVQMLALGFERVVSKGALIRT